MLTKPKLLRIFAGLALLTGVFLWLHGGARAGFYKTYYEVIQVDEVTGLEYPVTVEAFLPGIEPLAIGLTLFIVLVVASGLVRSRAGQSNNDSNPYETSNP